jgi:hypothetical protein
MCNGNVCQCAGKSGADALCNHCVNTSSLELVDRYVLPATKEVSKLSDADEFGIGVEDDDDT